MAEIKNSFLQSKMNKDLDDRLIPNGEYRDAQNISVGKSEADDIGALETILGNELSTNFGLTPVVYTFTNNTTATGIITITGDKTATIKQGMTIHGTTTDGVATEQQVSSVVYSAPNTIVQAHPGGWAVEANDSVTFSFEPKVIGYYSDDIKNKIIVFVTDYRDMYTDTVAVTLPYIDNSCYIFEFIPVASQTTLVSGTFLNFDKNKPISGINNIEDLLFWTDYRNQPRKINLDLAENNLNYYTNESSISVAKYNPYQPIGLLQKVTAVTTTAVSSATLAIADTTGIYKGMLAVQYGNTDFEADNYFYVSVVNTNVSVVLNAAPSTVNAGDITFLATTMTGEDITLDFNSGNPWPGDPDYLESRFVRFSYRFEFVDGEYSLMAPFTQIAYIPKQKGYFLGSGGGTITAIDENDAYQSTVVEFMENGVQNIDLLIPFPDILSTINTTASSNYKIQNCQILYKESDARAVKVLDTVESSEWTGTTTTNIYTYNYQSRKPFKVLPENQTVRVYDKVPVKALAQETSGNRIIYGNFLDKYSPPTSLAYTVGGGDKSTSENFNNWCEYPNHSLKQNRNYQVGFVLADKFGRQSDVILSSIQPTSTTDGGIEYGGDTIYHPYNTNLTQGTIRDWFGDALKVRVNTPISSGTDSGPNKIGDQPGLYAKVIGNGYNTYNANTIYQPTISGNTYIFHLGLTYTDVPAINTYLEGEYTDYVKVSNVTTSIESTTSSDNTAGGATTALVLVTGNANIKVGMVVSGGGLPAGVTIVTVTDSQNFVLSSTQNIPLNSSLTYSITEYTITTIGQVSSIYLQQLSSDPDKKFSYNINSIGWYSYKVVVKQQEQDYYNVYLPGIVKGYPYQDPTATDTPLFPDIPAGSYISNTVLINDNINKIPRDLSEVGPEQKQFRSSVQLFGRVENTMTANTPNTNPGIPNNIQYFPNPTGTTSKLSYSDTAITIAAASDANMGYEIFQDSQSANQKLYSTLTATGQASLYQLDSNPLIARLSTYKDIGAASLVSASTATPSMVPYLAIYETEPQDSLLEIFWETPTVGLISTLNDAILSDFDGATGWETYSSNLFTEAPAANFISGLSPVDSGGAILTDTSLSNFQVLDGSGNDKTSDFSYTRVGGAAPYTYTFAQVGTDFVYNYDSNPRTYTMSMIITNNATSTDSATLYMPIELQNVQPTINTGSALTPVVGVNDGYTGVLATDTYVGANGATDGTLKTQQLKWSISAGNSNNYFSINESSGVLSKIVSGVATAGTHNLTIKIEDAWNGVSLATGSLSQTAAQSVTVTSSVIGYMFKGSAMINFIQACPAGGAAPSDCESVEYWSQSALASSGLPTTGSTILTGSGGPGVSLPAADGYYALKVAPGSCATGSARMYMFIDDGAGTVKAGYPITCGP